MEPTIPPQDSNAETAADERLADGLLRASWTEHDTTHEHRVSSALATLDELPVASGPVLGWRLAISAAAALVVFAVFFLQPNPDAADIVDAARTVSREAGDRRYAISVRAPDDPGVLVSAEMDIRDPEHVLLRVSHTGSETWTWIGRNGDQQWVRDADGVVRPLTEQEDIAAWLGLRTHAAYLSSLDRLLDHLQVGFELREGDTRQLPDRPGRSFDHVTGVPAPPAEGKPARIDLWVDEARVVQRVVLEWGASSVGGSDNPHLEHADRHRHEHGAHRIGHHGPTDLPHTITLDLRERRRFPERWFEPDTHK